MMECWISLNGAIQLHLSLIPAANLVGFDLSQLSSANRTWSDSHDVDHNAAAAAAAAADVDVVAVDDDERYCCCVVVAFLEMRSHQLQNCIKNKQTKIIIFTQIS